MKDNDINKVKSHAEKINDFEPEQNQITFMYGPRFFARNIETNLELNIDEDDE